ncbi:hypothetical protein AGMMS50268_15380 [Spirochaetia bacterium]|nr:hypothetical protein AGMMS50268_15380 [Spirochaetia bacterium]
MRNRNSPAVLNFPFFTLEYREGVFIRKIPDDAEALRGGLFRQGDTLWKLSAEDAKVLPAIIRGKALLSLVSRGGHPLVAEGPRLAAEGERLMELSLERGPAAIPVAASRGTYEGPGRGPVIIRVSRELSDAKLWLPLEGLPRHRLYSNTVYEIIDEETLDRLAAEYGAKGKGEAQDRLILRGEEIPRFAAAHERLLYRFARGRLRRLLSEEHVFIAPEKLSLVLAAEPDQGAGARAVAALKYGKRLYSVAEVSGLLERDYILLDDKWAPRETLKRAGILPLSHLAGGMPIGEYRPGAADILRRGGKSFPPFFTGFECEGPWLRDGTPREIFISHLEFLRYWGISGGVILHGHREQAEFLASWIVSLAASIKKNSGALVLMEQKYCELYLRKHSPHLMEAIKNSGVEICFYEDLINPLKGPRPKWDVLILVEPEEMWKEPAIAEELSRIDTGLRLGIFSDLNSGGEDRGLKNFFGIRRDTRDLENHIIRNVKAPLSLPPQYQWSAAEPVQPPGTCRFTVEKKFRNIPAQDLITERERFRREKDRRSGAALILHARELILFVEGGPEKNLTELLKHYSAHRAILPWIMDFALIYNIPDTLPRLFPLAREIKRPLLTDLYLNHAYIKENNPISLDDIRLLVPHLFDSITAIPEKESERVLNAIDRYLREHFKIRFFEFFYPPNTTVKTFTAFEGLEGIGESSYTAEWVSFSSHKPLIDFLETLLEYVAYRTREENVFDKRRQVPPLSGVWKEIADAALEQRELRLPHGRGGGALKKERLKKLRDDSAKVRDLLRIGGEERGDSPAEPDRSASAAPFLALPPFAPLRGTPANRSGKALAEFLAGLGPVEGEALGIIAVGGDLSALEDTAQKGLTMPELIIDGINGQFNDLFHDILIETGAKGSDGVDEVPRIQAEYEAEIKKYYGK